MPSSTSLSCLLWFSFSTLAVVAGLQLPSFSASSLWRFIFPNQIRIVGGRPALNEECPYQALIRAYKGEVSYICGGSIISDQHILTAAHCLQGMDYMLVQVGSQSLKYQPGTPIFQVSPKDVILHKDYDQYLMKNDIAIIPLKYKIPYLLDYIKPVRLPKLSQREPDVFDDYQARISGWGKVHDSDTKAQANLQTAKVTVMPFWQCRIYFSIMYYELDDSQICTLYQGSGTCNGDSGGGLVIEEEDGIETIIGIVSFGTQLCESGSPGVYTNVGAYLSWISQHTGVHLRQ
ncbi:chymotrypsin-1-like [Rhodnius prolixus]|uniref:Peptidase S1 domain-containing protein n=1 Tax=Rhodnius prolixus TaxID=13249 RepID=T1HJM6_RHOPR